MTEKLEPIREQIEVNVPLDHLWQVMTEAATVPLWLGCMNYEATPGHTFYMQPDAAKRAAGDISGATHCDVTALSKPLFAFTWYMPGTPKTNVSFRLTSIGPKTTRVDFAHDGWDQFPAEMVRGIRDMLQGGWSSSVLPNLARVASGQGVS